MRASAVSPRQGVRSRTAAVNLRPVWAEALSPSGAGDGVQKKAPQGVRSRDAPMSPAGTGTEAPRGVYQRVRRPQRRRKRQPEGGELPPSAVPEALRPTRMPVELSSVADLPGLRRLCALQGRASAGPCSLCRPLRGRRVRFPAMPVRRGKGGEALSAASFAAPWIHAVRQGDVS